MFTRHHVTQKNQVKLLPSDVPRIPNFGPSAHGLLVVIDPFKYDKLSIDTNIKPIKYEVYDK